ncbi:MAG: outer membrane beta-barrel protein [Gammaproteobacteria bacterium]|nr:outer membrane beta-barrel protein [Gammaproteobacteria bacterium]
MFKKLLITGAVLAMTTGVALANSAPYFGISAGEQTNTNKYFNYRGIPGQLFVGYGANVGQGFYLAGEVIGTFGTGTIVDNGMKSTWGYGLSIIPGIMISEHTMGYLRAGVIRTQFQPKTTGSKAVSGGQFGVGMQTSLMQNWDVRGEYTYSSYSSLNGAGGSPASDMFTLGLIYKFD